MADELTPQEWQEEIEAGLEFRHIYSKESFWPDLDKLWLNDPSSQASSGENLVFEQGDALLSGVSVSNPYIMVEPEHPSSVSTAPAVEGLDNQLLRKLNLQQTVEDATLNNYLFGVGIIKLGYDSEFGYDPYFDAGTVNDPWGMTFTQFNKKGQRIEYLGINPGMPWMASVHPKDFVVPWGTKRIEDAPWCAHRVVRLNRDIKADPKYKNKMRLEPQLTMESYIESFLLAEKRKYRIDAEKRRVATHSGKLLYNELWEIHDRRTGKVYVICFDHKNFLRNKRDLLQVNTELPFITAKFVPSTRTFWSTPLSFYLIQHQTEMFDIAVQSSKQRRTSGLKWLILEEALSSDEEDKALGTDCGIFVKVNAAMTNLQNVVKAFPTANNYDLMNDANHIRGNARSVIGYSRNQMGEFDAASRRTATESTIVNQGSQKRESRRFNAVEWLYVEPTRKMNNMLFRFWKRQRSIKVGPKEWQQFAGADLRGDYSYDINLGTKDPMSLMQRKLWALQLFGTLAAIPGANISALWQYVSDASDDPAFANFFNFGQAGPMLPAGASARGGVGKAGAGTSPTGVQNANV
jgi:hypothetical protein